MEKRLKIKCVICGVLMIIGIIMAIASFQVKDLSEMQSGYMNGFGTSVAVASLVLLIKNVLTLRSPKNLRDREIQLTDERNIQISTKSMAITFRICILLQSLCSLALALVNNALGIYLGFIVGIQLVIYVFANVIISKKI